MENFTANPSANNVIPRPMRTEASNVLIFAPIFYHVNKQMTQIINAIDITSAIWKFDFLRILCLKSYKVKLLKPLYMNFRFFNMTNADEVKVGRKPKVK